jgi:tetrahydromethanopterin S-methyltransferase subunit G
MSHLLVNNLIKESQHGFMPGRSCTTNLVVYLDSLTEAKDKGKSVDIIYLDFSKAFDKVPHQRLLKKLRAKGVSEEISGWIEDWLFQRKQKVKIGNEFSEEGDVDSGVPQGTVLGPCLFNVFIDDVDESTTPETLLIKFADDTKVWRVIASEKDRQELQETLDNLCKWAEKWGMQFNEGKCKVMHIGQNNPRYEYTMNGQTLSKTEEEKDIGVYVNHTLKPGNQCKKAAVKAGQVLRQITKNFHYRDRRTYLKLYLQYVRPHLEFASPAWSPWQQGDIETLEKVQEKALRQITGLKSQTYEEKCKEVGIETLARRRYIQDMAQTFKVVKRLDRVDSKVLFQERDGERTRADRDGTNLREKHSRTDIRKNSFALRVVRPWNNLPSESREQQSVEAFKRMIRK